MKLKIRTIHAHGKASEEYVVLDVLENCNLNRYIVADTTYTKDGYISNKVRHTHWFTASEAKKDDIVILYTREGLNNETKQSNGSTIFHCYWELRSAVWNDDGDGAVLFEVNDWSTTRVAYTK
ncbi:hypothetical protein ACG1VR_08770 [Cedecea davisae]|uniref:hypothetical protein n=1 Tax=Cedecea davisae TaxID=158484 RepID=UPI00376ECC9D